MKINILTPIRKGGPYFMGKQLVEELNKRGFKAKHIHKLIDILLSPFYQNCDIIHSMDIPINYRLWKKPFILTIHGEYPIQKNIWRYFFPSAIRKATVLTTVSEFLKKRLDLKRAIVIPNAIDVNKFRQVIHKNKKKINIVTITKFYFKDKTKGILKLVRILEKVFKKTNKKINYVVVGGGKYLGYIQKQVKDSKIKINFTGFIDEPKKMLEKSDIFIYYSKHDNLPVVVLEAMASGLPVVTNNVGAIEEMISNKHDGFIAKSFDEHVLYITRLIDNLKLRKGIGINARKTIKQKFDWTKIIKEYIQIYETLKK